MIRRRLLHYIAALPLVSLSAGVHGAPSRAGRVRPGHFAWPGPLDWAALRQQVGGNLSALRSPLEACSGALDEQACRALFRELKNPYYIRDSPVLTQTCGWVGAWTAQPSAYAVAAHSTADVVAAVNFARERRLRLVVKGGGHSYLGTSNAPDSLLIWTRPMDGITVHDAFVPQGCEGCAAPISAVSVGGGAIWMHTYQAVTTGAGRYVQGGGCGTLGVAGLVQGGGFGSHSKAFGTAGSSLLEAEIVTADGSVRIVNARREPELFWALKGGGGGSFGVVTRMTLRTWDLPKTFGTVTASFRAGSDDTYRRLLTAFVAFYAEHLCNPHWGELARLIPGRRLEIGMNFQGLDRDEAAAVWRPFLAWIEAQGDLTATPSSVVAGPGRYRWDGEMLDKFVPGTIRHDDRPGAPAVNFFWEANLAEAGHVIHDFQSWWLSSSLLKPDRQMARGCSRGGKPALDDRNAFPKGIGRRSRRGAGSSAGDAHQPGSHRRLHARDRRRRRTAGLPWHARARARHRQGPARHCPYLHGLGRTAQGRP